MVGKENSCSGGILQYIQFPGMTALISCMIGRDGESSPERPCQIAKNKDSFLNILIPPIDLRVQYIRNIRERPGRFGYMPCTKWCFMYVHGDSRCPIK